MRVRCHAQRAVSSHACPCHHHYVGNPVEGHIFSVLLVVLSLVSLALVFHRTTRTMIYKSAAYQIRFTAMNTENRVNLKDIKKNISQKAKLPADLPF